MGVKDYDLNPDNNTQINGINIAEGCPPSGINNAMRQLMADVKEDSDAQDTAIEALEKKVETPASAEDLGPVKVGDGLTMGEDGTLSANLATAEAAGRVKASTTAQAGAVPVANGKGKLDVSWLPPFNSRLVITESNAAWTPPVTGWARVTVIGGGGAGTSWLAGSGLQLAWGTPGGDTTFGTITAQGGATSRPLSGVVTTPDRYPIGGGCAGEVITEYAYLNTAVPVNVTIGAGGVAGSGTSMSGYTKNPGTISVNDSVGTQVQGWGGSGARTGLGYGGGGGACGLLYGADTSAFLTHNPGWGHDGGKDAIDAAELPLMGGDGGQGAVIIEYYDPDKESV